MFEVIIVAMLVITVTFRYELCSHSVFIKTFWINNDTVIYVSDIRNVEVTNNYPSWRNYCKGMLFTNSVVDIQWIDKKGKTKRVGITPDNYELFVQQINNMIADSSISGYRKPNTIPRNMVLISYMLLNMSICYYFFTFFDNHLVIGGLYGGFYIVSYRLTRYIFNKKIYKSLHNDLNKYAIYE